MTTTIRAVFEEGVFRPDEPVNLEPHAHYVITVERERVQDDGVHGQEPYPLSTLGALATDMGVTDLASRHDWYARRRLGDENGEQASSDAAER